MKHGDSPQNLYRRVVTHNDFRPETRDYWLYAANLGARVLIRVGE